MIFLLNPLIVLSLLPGYLGGSERNKKAEPLLYCYLPMGKIVSANVSFLCKDFPSKGCIPASRTSQGAWCPRPTGRVSSGPYRLTLCKEMIPQGLPLPSCAHCRRHRNPPLQEPTAPDQGVYGKARRVPPLAGSVEAVHYSREK